MRVCRKLGILVILSAINAGTWGLEAGETFFFDDKEDWTQQGLVSNDDGTLGLQGGRWIYSAETFPVDPAAASTVPIRNLVFLGSQALGTRTSLALRPPLPSVASG
jgi:hypothetical protein